MITAPAPNAASIKGRRHNAKGQVETALRKRAGFVLLIAALERQRRLVLGAWGCGVFGYGPAKVANDATISRFDSVYIRQGS